MPRSGTGKIGEADKLRVAHNKKALDSVNTIYTNYPRQKNESSQQGLADYSFEVNKLLKRFGVTGKDGKPVCSIVHKPRTRITVMVVGNHSSGKSSFINWYVGQTGKESLLKTSMAIETKGICFVAQGNKQEEYGSDMTLRKFPEINTIAEVTGDKNIIKCLSTKLSTSSERLFPLVTFVDTPGLVDTTEYPFDVNKGIEAMASHCDKVLVFMDPMGKATSTKTMEVINILMKQCPDQTSFYLTKADSIDNSTDAMNVALQICKDMGQATNHVHNFKMPCIYLPHEDGRSEKENVVTNAIGGLCDDIMKCVKMKAQSNMSRLKKDSDFLLEWIRALKKIDTEKKSAKSWREQISTTLWIIVAAMILMSFLWVLVTFQSIVPDAITDTPLYQEVVTLTQPYARASPDDTSVTRIMSFVKFIGTFMLFTFMASFVSSRAKGYPTLSSNELERLNSLSQWIKEAGTVESDRIWSNFEKTVDGKKD